MKKSWYHIMGSIVLLVIIFIIISIIQNRVSELVYSLSKYIVNNDNETIEFIENEITILSKKIDVLFKLYSLPIGLLIYSLFKVCFKIKNEYEKIDAKKTQKVFIIVLSISTFIALCSLLIKQIITYPTSSTFYYWFTKALELLTYSFFIVSLETIVDYTFIQRNINKKD